MSYYFKIANRIEVVSQTTVRNMVYRFFIQKNERGEAEFSAELDYEGITLESQKKYDILSEDGRPKWEHGTRLRFFDPTKDGLQLIKEADKIPEDVRDVFGYRWSKSPNLETYFWNNGVCVKLGIPDYIREHPEEHISTLKGEDGQDSPITGRLYEDKDGFSKLKVIGEGGMLIYDDYPFSPPRQVS